MMQTVQAVRPTFIRPVTSGHVAARQVRFGASQDSAYLSSWLSKTRYVHPHAMSRAFMENVGDALVEVWNAFPTGLQTAFERNRFQVVLLPPQLNSIYAFLEDDQVRDQSLAFCHQIARGRVADGEKPAQADGLESEDARWRRKILEFVQIETPADRKLLASIQESLKQQPAHSDQVAVIEALQGGKIPDWPTDKLEREVIQLHLAFGLMRHHTPLYLSGVGKIILQDIQTSNFFSAYTGSLVREIRHETGHFVDDKLGCERLGRPFSRDKGFRAAILEDQKQAIEAGRWPTTPDKAAWAKESGQEEVARFLQHYFPEAFKTDNHYAEAFAECFSAFFGGGATEVEHVRKLYPRAMAWVEENVLRPYESVPKAPPTRNVLDWLHRHCFPHRLASLLGKTSQG